MARRCWTLLTSIVLSCFTLVGVIARTIITEEFEASGDVN